MTNDDVTNQQTESSDQTAEPAQVGGLGLGLDETPPVTPAMPETKEQA